MNTGVGLIGIMLDGRFQSTRGRGGEDGPVAGVVVEWVAVYSVGRILCGEEEYGAGVGR